MLEKALMIYLDSQLVGRSTPRRGLEEERGSRQLEARPKIKQEPSVVQASTNTGFHSAYTCQLTSHAFS